MAIVSVIFDPRVDLPTGNHGVIDVTVKATPTRIREDGDSTIYPETVTFSNVTGATPLQLQATDGTWAWTIGVWYRHKIVDVRTVSVAPSTTRWADLVDVDPDTFLPALPGTTVGQLLAALRADLTAGLADRPTTTQVAGTVNTAVTAAVTALIGGAPGALDTLKEIADAIGDDPNYATTIATALAAKAPLASPAFTGTVTGITKTMVGLGNVDNTSDANKPVSTAQAAANAAILAAAEPAGLSPATTAALANTYATLPGAKRNGLTGWFHVDGFGADPTGVNDSTAAIQAAITASLAAGDPSTTTRFNAGRVYLPGSGVQGVPAKYKVTSTLLARSVQGLMMSGAGAEQVQLVVSGLTGAPLLWIDGSYRSTIGGFTVVGDGTEALSDVIRLDWSVNAKRSSTANKLHDIQIRNSKWVNGVVIASDAATQGQNDACLLERVVVAGNPANIPQNDATYWQNGFLLNPVGPTHSNNYNHWLIGSYAAYCVNGVNCQYSSFSVRDAEPFGNGVDFRINGVAGGTVALSDVNSQSSGRFLVSDRTSSSWTPISIRDSIWQSSFPASDGRVISVTTAGALLIENTACRDNTGTTPLSIYASPSTALTITLSGFAMTTPYASAMSVNNKTQLVVLDYKQLNTSGGVVATYSSLVVPENGYASYTAAGTTTFTVPAGVTTLRCRIGGGGGGGGGGGSAAQTSGTNAQVGGGGGGQGLIIDSQLTVTPDQVLNLTIGAGGNGGAGGAASTSTTGSAGGAATQGGNTSVTGTGVALLAGGGAPGAASAANSTSTVFGGAMGVGNTAAANYIPGAGGGSGRQAIPHFASSGGAGGAAATATLGGLGGGAGRIAGNVNPGTAGGSATTTGGDGAAATFPSAGGGGGGAGAPGGAGGAGGAGSAGIVEFWWS